MGCKFNISFCFNPLRRILTVLAAVVPEDGLLQILSQLKNEDDLAVASSQVWRALTGMKAQQALLETRVPSGQTVVFDGAALATATRATKERSALKAIG